MNASLTLSDHPKAVMAGALVRPAGTGSGRRVPGTNDFSISVGRALGAVVVTLHGEIDTTNARHLEEILKDLIENQENLQVVVEMRDVTRIDPTGVAALMTAAAHAHQRGGAFTVTEPRGSVYESLTETGDAGDIPVSGPPTADRRLLVHAALGGSLGPT